MGLPSINITIKQLADTAIMRVSTGIVAILIIDEAKTGAFILKNEDEIPTDISAKNQEYIKRAFIGGEQKPNKIVLCFGSDVNILLSHLEVQLYDFVCVCPDMNDEGVLSVANFVKLQRDTNQFLVKAVLPNIASDHEGIINFTTDNIKVSETCTLTCAECCSRIAGLLAGTSPRQTITYYVLEDALDVPKFTNAVLSAKIDAGELVLIWDMDKVRIARGVNSLTSVNLDKTKLFKHIQPIEIMDMIKKDLTKTFKDYYIGKMQNTYNNKCVLLSAITDYLKSLNKDELIADPIIVEIDISAQKEYLQKNGTDTSKMSDDEIKRYNTDTQVFFKMSFKIINSIEDIVVTINV